MLFDLKGRRRRVIQAIYLVLAVLMGGGLVLFGIGSDVQGGLFDIFDSGGPSNTGSAALEERLDDAEARLRANPEDEEALTEVVRSNYQLAVEQVDPATGALPQGAVGRLEAADGAWERYLNLNPEPPEKSGVVSADSKQPDVSLAGLMIQAYGEGALDEPEKAVTAAELVAQGRETSQSYILLARYASLAGQKGKAELAGEKAIELAPKEERKTVAEQVKTAKEAASAAAAQQLLEQGGATPPEAPAGGGGGRKKGGAGGDEP